MDPKFQKRAYNDVDKRTITTYRPYCLCNTDEESLKVPKKYFSMILYFSLYKSTHIIIIKHT